MSSLVQYAPRFTEQDAIGIAHDLYGLEVTAQQLPSERDQNFQLTSLTGEAYVLKVANAIERLEVLNFQNLAMTHIARKMKPLKQHMTLCPEVCAAQDGEGIGKVKGIDGTNHFVRLLTYLPGKPFATVRPHDSKLLVSLGKFFGSIDHALEDFNHPATHRDFHWDLKNASRVVNSYMDEISDLEKRAMVKRFLTRFQSEVEPQLQTLRTGVIHNDGNDYNVLVEPDGRWHNKVTGVIDFGDMVHTCTVSEVAITCAYAMMNKADPLAAGTQVVAGYHQVHPLNQQELAALFDLICMRLCMSVCHSAHQYQFEPDNEYLRISEKPAWTLLGRLACIHPRFAHFAFRHACGLSPVPQAEKIVQWLKRQSHKFASPVDDNLRAEKQLVFDLSVGSPLVAVGDELSDTPTRSKRLFEQMKAANLKVGIGRYDEARLVYTAGQFETQTDEMPERRTIHLGIDLYKKSGSQVYAPLDGSVHSFKNNTLDLDYGPTIILEHQTDAGDRFCTLYGHLSPDSLVGLESGMPVAKGKPFARIGEPETNGGWPPHLHFQIITDMLGEAGNFPGVARPSERNIWKSISPDPNIMLGIARSCFPDPGRSHAQILVIRRKNLGKNLSIAYHKPLKIVRGRGQYLFSEDGQTYLDGVNNVCHVGHCHPEVIAAGQRQMAVLNTNTRYLHDNIVAYTKRLLSKFPEPLNVCFFVCTGSEANELALRMARNYTGQHDVITVDGAYHGNTQTLIDVSPYKHDGPGGRGTPAWVHKVVMPDGYRGPHKGTNAATGARYAEYVSEAIDRIHAHGKKMAAFICESMLGCGGQVVLPANYLCESFKHVRAAGGLNIVDEVQVGFGRVGSHFWAFETQAVVPDIVTLGKPMGNGHPLAAVITTPEIADAFANGMEYFNTFGGNPVSCAVGTAVLDVIEKEALQKNAQKVGARLLKGLQELMNKYPLIGDVRGLGLYVGIELVTDRRTLNPAPQHATYIINRMKDHGILMSIDGHLHNVLKLKPPMVFNEENADELVQVLDKVLGEDCLQV
ncbi:MAG: aminotransferase class III-fold pyridoxal phosphate-dependent enzyme [Deltaproteobacteria bacterium]|nr:MAG: aminotransferase class III-fold pyridoxal phosphate-dependent enzyme [Deltaproteobacteria bacterium]